MKQRKQKGRSLILLGCSHISISVVIVITNSTKILKYAKKTQTSDFDEKLIFETEEDLELEAKSMVNNLRRPGNPKVNLDFVVERASSEKLFLLTTKE